MLCKHLWCAPVELPFPSNNFQGATGKVTLITCMRSAGGLACPFRRSNCQYILSLPCPIHTFGLSVDVCLRHTSNGPILVSDVITIHIES